LHSVHPLPAGELQVKIFSASFQGLSVVYFHMCTASICFLYGLIFYERQLQWTNAYQVIGTVFPIHGTGLVFQTFSFSQVQVEITSDQFTIWELNFWDASGKKEIGNNDRFIIWKLISNSNLMAGMSTCNRGQIS
jgi:hypothetical protein